MERMEIEGNQKIRILTSDNSEFLLEGIYIPGSPNIHLMVTFPDDFTLSPASDQSIYPADNAPSLHIADGVYIHDGKVVICMATQSDVDFSFIYTFSEDNDPEKTRIEVVFGELKPEEPVRIKDQIFTIEDVAKITVDPELLIELLNRHVVMADEEVLRTYGILPKFRLYENGKVKRYF